MEKFRVIMCCQNTLGISVEIFVYRVPFKCEWYNAEDKKLGKRVSKLELDFRSVKMVIHRMILRV